MSKFCSNCGRQLDESADLCLGCGKVLCHNKNKDHKKFNGVAVAGFIISILSLVIFFLPFTFVIGIVALILSIVGLVKSKTLNDGKGLSIGGIVISSITICLSTLFSFLFFLAVIFEIEESEANHACVREYGYEYKAVEGFDFPGHEDDYDWYCCLKSDIDNFGSCELLDWY